MALPGVTTNMLAPSKAIALGGPLVLYVPTVPPPIGSFVTELLPLFVTHILAPSKAIPDGFVPTGMLDMMPVPDEEMRTTVALPLLVTHTS